MAGSTNYTIKGDIPGLFGSLAMEATIVDKPGNVNTRTLFNDGPDSLTVQPVTITNANDPIRGYSLGAGSTLTAGQSTTITVQSKMKSAGVSNIRIADS